MDSDVTVIEENPKTAKQVKKVLMAMKNEGASGPNGFPIELIKTDQICSSNFSHLSLTASRGAKNRLNGKQRFEPSEKGR